MAHVCGAAIARISLHTGARLSMNADMCAMHWVCVVRVCSVATCIVRGDRCVLVAGAVCPRWLGGGSEFCDRPAGGGATGRASRGAVDPLVARHRQCKRRHRTSKNPFLSHDFSLQTSGQPARTLVVVATQMQGATRHSVWAAPVRARRPSRPRAHSPPSLRALGPRRRPCSRAPR